jgi:hypothetical protein
MKCKNVQIYLTCSVYTQCVACSDVPRHCTVSAPMNHFTLTPASCKYCSLLPRIWLGPLTWPARHQTLHTSLCLVGHREVNSHSNISDKNSMFTHWFQRVVFYIKYRRILLQSKVTASNRPVNYCTINCIIFNCLWDNNALYFSLEFTLSPCFECCILSFSWFPVVWILSADFSEHSVLSSGVV